MGESAAQSGAGPLAQDARNGRVLQFGAFELKTATGEIRKQGVRIRLQGKPLHLLQALLERPGTVVTREELRDRLWAAQTFVDFESGLNTAVNRLRLALGDSADNPRYVETLARTGYRFVAPVSEHHPPAAVEETAAAAPTPIRAPTEVPSRAAKRHRGGTLVRWAAMAVCLAALAAAIWVARRAPVSPTFHQISFRRIIIRAARFSPDGHSVIYNACETANDCQLFTADTVSPESRPLGFQRAVLASISRLGELALITRVEPTREWSLVRVPINGGAPLPLDQRVRAADWAPDGSRMAVIRYGKHPMTVEYPRGKTLYQSAGWLSCIRVSPSGDEVAFIDHPLSDDDGGNVMVAGRSGKPRVLSSGWASAEGLAWSPNGREIWFTAARAGVTRAPYAVTLSGRLRLVASLPGTVTLYDISPSGRVLVSRDQPHAMMMRVDEGKARVQDLSWFDYSSVQDISADGRVVLFDESGEGGGPHHSVYVRRADSPAAVRVSDGFAMAISPDGNWVLARPDGNQTSLRLIPLAPGEQRVISGHQLQYDFARFFPSGDRLLVGGSRAGAAPRLFVQSVDGSAPVPLATSEYLANPAISIDGHYIAGVDSEHRLLILPVAGGEPSVLATSFTYDILGWSPSGKSLLAQSRDVPAAIYRIDVSRGGSKFWKQISPVDFAGVSYIWPAVVSRDERTIVYSFQRNLCELFVVEGWS